MATIARTVIDPLPAVATFYGLDALRQAAKTEPFRPSHERWRADLEDLWGRLVPRLARCFYDYLALACFGEARHADREASHYIEDFPADGGDSRGEAVVAALGYDPRQFLPVLERLFFEARWQGGFGGESWGRIAKAAQLYGRLPDAVFVDHVVDLTHNGGLCFDKEEAGLHVGSRVTYLEILDRKRRDDPSAFLEFLCHFHYTRLPWAFVKLVLRAVALELVVLSPWALSALAYRRREWAMRYTWPDEQLALILEYEPVEWGEEELDGELARSSRWVTCDGCDEDIPEGDAYSFGGYTYCSSCYEERVSTCDHCNKAVWAEDLWWSEAYDGWLCESCREELLDYCASCGCEILVEDAIWDDGSEDYVCQDCAKSEDGEVA